MFIISTASSLVVSIESNVVVVSISFRISFSLTDITPLTPEVTVVVISVVAISIVTVIPSVITITHGIIVSIPTVPSILSISFSLRFSKDRKDKEGCNKLKQR